MNDRWVVVALVSLTLTVGCGGGRRRDRHGGGSDGGTVSGVCGNGRVDGSEPCDGANLQGQTCNDLGYSGGTLACEDDCQDFDTTACVGSSATAPTIVNVQIDPATISEGDAFTVTVTATDPDGDIAGGSVRHGGSDLGSLTSTGTGTYTLTSSWDDLQALMPINFATSQARALEAYIYDDGGLSATQNASITLDCGGAPACNGLCDGCGEGTEGDVRVTGTNDLLEVFHDGRWLGVCDDSFDAIDGAVACGQLGLTYVAFSSTAGPSEDFWLDDLACTGGESRLGDCSHNGWGVENCSSSESVSLTCSTATTGDDGSLRQLDFGGRRVLQMYHSGEWRGVCDDSFDLTDASVACRQLGFSSAATYATSVTGPTDTFWLDDLGCLGTETRLIDCPHNGLGNHNCSSSEHVELTCI